MYTVVETLSSLNITFPILYSSEFRWQEITTPSSFSRTEIHSGNCAFHPHPSVAMVIVSFPPEDENLRVFSLALILVAYPICLMTTCASCLPL